MFTLLPSFLVCFCPFCSFLSRSVSVLFHSSRRRVCLSCALQLLLDSPCLAVPRSNDMHPGHIAVNPNSSKFSREKCTLASGLGHALCLQLFSVLLIHHYHFALETLSIHLWVIFTFAPWDRHNRFQIASIPSLLGRFSPNSSRQPHAFFDFPR